MAITERDLESLFAAYSKRYGGRKEDYFPLAYLRDEFQLPEERAADQVAFGGNDYGIDAYHIDPVRRNLYLFQFKWSTNHSQFKTSFDRLTKFGLLRVFGNPTQDQRQNDLLLQLKSELDENRSIIDQVIVAFVFNGDPQDAERSTVLDSKREDLESRKHLIDEYFGDREVSLTVQFRSNETRRRTHSHQRRTHRYPIRVDSKIEIGAANQAHMMVGFVPLLDLHQMYREMGMRLFARNIRAGLSPDRSANRSLRKAIDDIAKRDAPSDEFVFKHNGVTLAVEHAAVDKDGLLELTEPRVLNGAQTITTLDHWLVANQDAKSFDEWRDKLSACRVLTKMITNADDDFIVTVTIANNRQNPVEAWNLRASDQIQLELEDRFREAGVFYERQENAFEPMTDEELDEMGIRELKAVQIRKLAQTFLAAQGEVDRMSRLTDVFDDDLQYKQAFRQSHLTADVRKILVAYKIQFRLNAIAKYVIEQAGDKYLYIKKAKNLLWALLIQGLFNEKRLETLLESNGRTMSVDADFSEHLKDVAYKKVRLLISDAIQDERSQSMLITNPTSLLRSKAVYARCLDAAESRYGWTRQGIAT